MADTTNDIWNDDDGAEEVRPRRHGLRNFLIFFLTLAAVLLVVLAAAWRDGTGLDALRRYVTYGREKEAGTGYVFDASARNRFAALGDRLAVLSETQLALVDGSGSTVWSTTVKMTDPALSVGGGRAVAYDVGGTELYVLDNAGLCYQIDAEEDEPYLSATLNSAGELTVTARKKNYKAAVTVYGGAGDERATFHSSERFVANAYATNDGHYLAAVTLGQSGGGFASSVVLYDLTGGAPADTEGLSGGVAIEPMGSVAVSGGMCLDIGQVGSRLALVCDTDLTFVAPGEDTMVTYDYGGSYLREYDLGGEGYAALLLNRYQSGSVARLVTVGADGQELAALPVNEEVLSVSAAGRYLAVLYADRLVIYNPTLEEYASLAGAGYAREALVGTDGSALLLASDNATRFLP